MSNKQGNRNALFSKTVVRNPESEGDDSISISMECDDVLDIQLSVPTQLTTYEAFSMGCPVLVISFLDGRGDLMNAKKLDTNATYILNLASYDGSEIESKWKLSHIEHINTSIGQSSQGAFSLHFIHDSWKAFAYDIHCRGWAKKKYSDVIEEIASECGFEITGIEETNDTLEYIQQPNWPNARFIRWMMERSSPSEGSGEFEYSVSIDGKFMFAPFSAFINRTFQIREGATKPIELYVGAPQTDEKRRSSARKQLTNVQAKVLSYSVLEQSNAYHKQGAGGVVNSWYDFDTAEYTREPFTYSDSSNLQLSEWSVVNEEWETSPVHLNHGRNALEAEYIGENRITSIVNGMNQVRVVIPTSTVVRVGELVNFTIDNPPEYKNEQGQKNEIHSGLYVVASVKNTYTSRRGAESFKTELLLVRQGNDKKESNYYTKSKGGKA